MDTLSIGASRLSIHQRDDDEKDRPDDAFREMITSCRSLSNYESNTLKCALPQIIAAILTASFHIVIGISLAFSAILIPKLESSDSDIHATVTESSWIASVIVISVPIGCILAGFLMESHGRLNTIKMGLVPCVLGWAIIAMAPNVLTIILGRMLTGFGCALGTSPAIVYITEVSRPDLRGSLISSAPTIASLGMVLVYIKGSFMTWRAVAWSGIGYTIASTLLIHVIVPESPVWLVSRGRIEDAAKSLQMLYKAYPRPEHTDKPLSEMHLEILIRENETRRQEKMRSASKASFAEYSKQGFFKRNKTIREFMKPTGYKPMIVLFFLFLIQQFSGIYITLFYAVTFFEEIGTDVNAYTASIMVGMVRLLMSILNAWLLKRFKRRPLVMVSAAGMATCMFISGLFTLWIKEGTTQHTWVPVACLLLFVAFSMFGLLTIPWTMTAELFPTAIRGIAHSISYSTANVLMFFAIQCYRPMLYLLGGVHAVQWLFAAVSLSGLLFAIFFLPETHGKKLKEIEDHFMGKKAAAATAKAEQAMEKDSVLTKSLVNGSEMSRSNSRGSGGFAQKPTTRRGERKISRNSLTCVPEVEQMIVDKSVGENGAKSLV